MSTNIFKKIINDHGTPVVLICLSVTSFLLGRYGTGRIGWIYLCLTVVVFVSSLAHHYWWRKIPSHKL